MHIQRERLIAITEKALATLAVEDGSDIPDRIRSVARTTTHVYYGDMYNRDVRCGCPLYQAEVLDEAGADLTDDYLWGFWPTFDNLMSNALQNRPLKGLVEVIG